MRSSSPAIHRTKGKNTKKTARNKKFATFLFDKDFFRKINYNNPFIKPQKDFEKYSGVASELTREVDYTNFGFIYLKKFIFILGYNLWEKVYQYIHQIKGLES
jgi:hypothetical protein